MYLLDTDHLGVIQRATGPQFTTLIQRLRECSPDELFAAIISFHEQVAGWQAYLKKARSVEQVVQAYAMFQQVLFDFNRMNVLPFDQRSAESFVAMRAEGVRIGTMDLRIASIALTHRLTVLTRNIVDFAKVPGLQVEDWTQ